MAKDKEPEVKEEKHVDHKNIYAALSAFQGELKPLEKSGKVSFKTSKGDVVEFTYTPLDQIVKTIAPLLSKHGLSFRHEIVKEGTKDAVVAIVTHETFAESDGFTEVQEERGSEASKERVTTKTPTARVKNQIRSGPIVIAQGGSDMKDTGSAITYARRYSLSMALGLASEEDKDAPGLEKQSAKNAQGFAYGRAKQGIEKAEDEKALDKALNILEKDLELVTKNKAGALGLTAEAYEELIAFGATRRKQIQEGLKADGTPVEEPKE